MDLKFITIREGYAVNANKIDYVQKKIATNKNGKDISTYSVRIFGEEIDLTEEEYKKIVKGLRPI